MSDCIAVFLFCSGFLLGVVFHRHVLGYDRTYEDCNDDWWDE